MRVQCSLPAARRRCWRVRLCRSGEQQHPVTLRPFMSASLLQCAKLSDVDIRSPRAFPRWKKNDGYVSCRWMFFLESTTHVFVSDVASSCVVFAINSKSCNVSCRRGWNFFVFSPLHLFVPFLFCFFFFFNSEAKKLLMKWIELWYRVFSKVWGED